MSTFHLDQRLADVLDAVEEEVPARQGFVWNGGGDTDFRGTLGHGRPEALSTALGTEFEITEEVRVDVTRRF